MFVLMTKQVCLSCNTRTKIYAGRVACCPLVSYVENAPHALLRLEKDAASVTMVSDQVIQFSLRGFAYSTPVSAPGSRFGK